MVVHDPKTIISNGKITVKVKVNGVLQNHDLVVLREKTSVGEIPVLTSRHYIPKTELVRLAGELGLPIKFEKDIAFPPGKMASHFVSF